MSSAERTDETYPRLVKNFDVEADRLRSKGDALGLKSGGGDGTSGGMEARVARLESDVDHIKRDVGELKIDVRSLRDGFNRIDVSLARLEERVSHLPGKGFIVSSLVTTIGLLTAILIFADKLRLALGVTH